MLNDDFFEEETISGYLVSKEMKEVWACELDMLERLLKVCELYNLKCWADSGTLIGAIRHKGFIPWDDDIDMVMFRDDYDKLVEIANKEFVYPYFFQTIYSDEYYGRRHAQIRNSETAAIANPKSRFNQGIFIDIFVLDGVPDVPRTLQKHLSKVKRYKQALKIVSKIINYFPYVLYKRCRWDRMLYARYEDVLRSVSVTETELVSTLSVNYKTKIKNRSCYDKTEYIDFEDIKIPVPGGYDKLLRQDFGDYMIPIHQPTLHGKLHFDVKRSYKDILKL